jgi:hypothetical protein
MLYSNPDALTWEEWESWEQETRRKYPVQYFFRRALPRFWRRSWQQYIHEPIYFAKCWLWRRHNIVVCRDLPVTWMDRDHILLHANFQVLKDFVEKEKPFEHFDTENSHNKEGWLEVKRLYDWWEQRRLLKDEPDDQYDIDNSMLTRLIAVRKHLWT